MKFETSALVIALDECEPILAPYRRRYTKDGAQGMMAHITILYPFCDSEAWNDATAQALSATVSAVQPFRLTLNRLGRFPESGVLYLEPGPVDIIVSLIRRVSEAFPEFPPYEGTIPLEQIKPHATIAASLPVPDLDAVESEFAGSALPLLPRNLLVKDLWLFVKSNEKWRKHSPFSLGEADAGPGATGKGKRQA